MARLAVSAFIPAGDADIVLSVAATTQSAIQTSGKNRIFVINATQDITISFGGAGGAAGAAPNAGTSNYRIPAGTQILWDMGGAYTAFQVYNLGASTATIYIKYLSVA